ncbi:hypothetical protein ACHQM5_008817 [Ranunculus cassubicifolius]
MVGMVVGMDDNGGKVTFGIVGIVVGKGKDGMGGRVVGMVGNVGFGSVGLGNVGIVGSGGNVGSGTVGTTGKAGVGGVSKRCRDAITRVMLENDIATNKSTKS